MHAGAIDVDELSYALEMMGVHKSNEEVQEMMDAVDTEGQGEACHLKIAALRGLASVLSQRSYTNRGVHSMVIHLHGVKTQL